MNIIFGTKEAELLKDKYTVLELDTVTIKSGAPMTVYCAIENVPLTEFSTLKEYCDLHSDLIANYKNRNWTFCEHAIEQLVGRWSNEVDSFYADLQRRVLEYKANEPDSSWTGIVNK